MGSYLERTFPSKLAAGLRSDDASLGRGRKRDRRRFEAVLLPLEDRRLLSMFPVTSTADDGSTGTLRWAVAGANADTSPSTIVFELGSAAATIKLTQGQLELSNTKESVTIDDGPGQGPVTISGNNESGAFQVDLGVKASISGLTITDGGTKVGNLAGYGSINDLGTLNLSDCTITNNPLATNTASGIYVSGGTADITDCTITGVNSSEGSGVAVNGGTADITGSTIDDNTGAGTTLGAGVFNGGNGTITLVNCTISGNSAGGGGGGLWNSYRSQLKVYGCTISGNTSGKQGAGVVNSGTAYLSGCTISGNSNDNSGGGVWNSGTIDVSDCTISGNTASVGGGLDNYSGTATLVACTISSNTTTASGGGIYVGGTTGPNTVTLNNTIVADNESAPSGGSVSPSDISGRGVSGSNDLVGIGGSAGLTDDSNGNIILTSLTDLDLAPLGDYGGPTETMALLPGSRAIAAGSKALEVGPEGAALTTDQRGEPLDTPVPDIGAYQTQPPVSLSFTGLTSPSIAYGTASVTISGTLANGSKAPPDTESVPITLDGVTQPAPIGTAGAFSTTFDTSTLPASATPYTVTYSYAGDANFAAATTTSTVTVSKDTPTVKVTDSGGTYNGAAFDATATVTGAGGSAASSLEGVAPTLTYYAGATAAGTPLSSAPIDAGTYTVVASFAGSADYSAVHSAPVTFTIGRASAMIVLASSGGSAVYGQPVTFVTTVAAGAPAAGAPTGTVTFFDGATALATVPLDSSGTAALTTSVLAVGSHSITATFNGTADFLGVESGSASESVAQAGTEVVLVPQPVFKKKHLVSVNLTAEIVPLAPGGGGPTGMVAFELLTRKGKKIKIHTFGEMSVKGGQATLTVKASRVLDQSITIVYGGDTDFLTSTATSPKLTQKGLNKLAH
jgi:hypothetical protein